MLETAMRKLKQPLFTALGLPVAIVFLLAAKVHFHTVAQLSAWLMKSALLKKRITQRPLASAVVALCVYYAMLVGLSLQLLSVPLVLLAFLGSLALIDCSLQEVGQFPETVDTVLARCNRTWVRHLKAELRDAEQLPLIRHIVDLIIISGVAAAASVLLAGTSAASWLLLVPPILIYLRSNGLWQEIVHIDSHTRFMRPKRNRPASTARLALSMINFISEWWLSQFYGMFPGWYLSEHIGNHHPEINSKNDVETLQYVDRTCFMDFATLTGRIIANTATGYGMYGYFLRTNKRKYWMIAVRGAAVHAVTIALAFVVSAPLGTWLLIASAGFGFSLAMIALTDHGLADPQDPGNVYRNSYNVLWTVDDHGQYGARYHLTHHLRPAPSWGPRTAALAQQHQQSLFREQESILFHGFANPDDLLRAYWNDDADYLYPYVVSVGSTRPAPDEWRRIFSERIRPAGARRPGSVSRHLSRIMTQLTTSHIQSPLANKPGTDPAS